MEIENRVELPDGHLVNLSPRDQRESGQCQQQYQAYRANYTFAELSSTPPWRNVHQDQPRASELVNSQSPTEDMFHRTKATKLPLPKNLNDRGRDQRNQTPSPTGIPKPSPTAFSSGGSGGQSGEREQYWQRVRDKFEKDSLLSQRASFVRSRESDQNGSPSYGSSRSQGKYSREDQPLSRGGNPRSGIPSPSAELATAAQSSRNDSSDPVENQRKYRKNGDSWVSLELNETTPQRSDRTDTTTESSPHSHPSISPISAEDSMTDWEDRFVVNMPTAKDPNPPTMTAQQIAEYQKTIERARRERSRVGDPNTGPSPRHGSPASAQHHLAQRDDSIGSFKAYDGGPTEPHSEVDQQSPPSQQNQQSQQSQQQRSQRQQGYYSPDEIGKNRISTIWEESPTKPREKRASHNADGSFLGCKEINGPGTKNPDEILLFGSGEDSRNLHPRPLAVGARKRQKEEKKSPGGYSAPPRSGDRTILQEEWAEVSRNSRHAQCSKLSSVTLCHDHNCSEQDILRKGSQGSEKENSRSIESASNSTTKLRDVRGDDDVFIITPTITRTLIPTAGKKQPEKKAAAPKPHGLRRPGGTGQSGTGEAVKAVRAKAQVISTPSGLRPAAEASRPSATVPSLASSKTTQLSSIPTPKEASAAAKDAKDMKDIKEPKGSKTTAPGKGSIKDKNDPERSTASSSIRGFIRTSGLARSSGLVRSPTDSLATILRNGTESLRNRAESLRNSRKGSPISALPSRDNSDSSRSEKSFKSAKESPRATPPPSTRPSPAKKDSPASKLSSVERPPSQKLSPFERSSPAPVTDKLPSVEKSPPPPHGKLSRAERLEKFKEEARARRVTRMTSGKCVDIADIAELDGHQVSGRKDYLQSNITDVTDVCEDLLELNSREKDERVKECVHPIALSMIFEIVVVAVTNMHKLALQVTDNPYAKFVATNVLSMVRHCYRVFSQVVHAVSQYQTTGTWPKAKNDKAVSRFLVELLQAVVYLIILGFSTLVVCRATSYVLLVGSWILWFARPFAWAFNFTTRALMV
ncbi:uncharacterized protein N7482_001856 [Penicillium canariense]|uniref:NTP binding protein n=1 Tax=Penicillium canariense TaxID=189055 RepID=A0A9W9IGS6_9EURO|nr:uncharacterized protein N7482_001856 [Penicillium canariense]KAJ5175979.1 hypothetical protein N7482_001856 [Penicillium canariense]